MISSNSIISSVHNPLIKEIIGLRESKQRAKTGLVVIDGLREIQRAFEAGIAIERIIYCSELIKNAAKIKAKHIQVTEHVFNKLAYGDRHEGILAVAHIKPPSLSNLKLSPQPFIVIIESLEKPGNLGAILRTCDGAGVDALFVCDTKTDIYNPNVIRASTGVIFSLPTIVCTNQQALDFCTQHKLSVTGAFPDAKTVYSKSKFQGPLCLVLGTEDKGLSAFWQGNCTQKVSIPMKGKADSLNVSVSAAILIYEALRQRSSK